MRRYSFIELVTLHDNAVVSARWAHARGIENSADFFRGEARKYLAQIVVRILTLGIV